MLIHIRRFAGFFAIVLLAAFAAEALDTQTRSEKIDSLNRQLKIALTASDSINPLYEIFDLTYGRNRLELAKNLYFTARNARNMPTRLDMLRHIANLGWKEDSTLNFVKAELEPLKNLPEAKSTQLFVDMLAIDNLLNKESNEDNNNKVIEYVRRYSHDVPSDNYERALLLYAVCRYLGQESPGELLESYIDRLDQLVETMDLPDGAVRRLIYNRAAPTYCRTGNLERVIATDMKLLHEIDSLELAYSVQNRNFYNAPVYRYTSLRRMLGCYPVLGDEEVEEYYGRILRLAEIHPNIALDLETNERAEIYYAMATSDYYRAKELLLKHIDTPANIPHRLQLLRMLNEAADKTGDKATLLSASRQLNEELEKQLDKKHHEHSRELQLMYHLSELLQRNSELQQESHLTALKARTLIALVGFVAIAALVILAVMLFRQKRNSRRLTASLKKSNQQLRAERDALSGVSEQLEDLRLAVKKAERHKNEFINNMSHEIKVPLAAIAEYTQLITDCIPENQRAYLDRFASIININVRMVMRLVNDVLDTDSIESGQMSLQLSPTSINDICHLAIDNVFECGRCAKENIVFEFIPQCDDDTLVETDSQRVSQVLVNLLTNAVKFSDEGTITLTYTLDRAAETLSFIVTDEGRGIPDGQEEAIFERFKRLDHTTPGCGVGLYISRLIARLLRGSLKADMSYKGGARFIFTIPTKA